MTTSRLKLDNEGAPVPQRHRPDLPDCGWANERGRLDQTATAYDQLGRQAPQFDWQRAEKRQKEGGVSSNPLDPIDIGR